MYLFIYSIILYASCYSTIKIESHVSVDHNENLLSLHSSTQDFIESTFILVVNAKRPVVPELDTLDEALQRDSCVLLYSAIGENDLLFKVYCNTDVGNTTGDIPLETILRHTLSDYLYHFFEKDDVQIERNKFFRRPHFFYGNNHMLEYAARMDAGKSKSNSNQKIMMPSDDAMNRIKAQNYIETNVGWNLDRIDQHTGMLDQRYQYILNTPDIDIYIIDTGIRVTHDEFENRATFLINTVGDGIDDDRAGHGTFCASEAAGKTYGVANKAHLYGVKVLDSLGDGDLFTIQAGILQVIETSRRHPSRRAIASMSLGGVKSTSLENAVANLAANNIVVSVSAGNSGADACLYSPSALGGIPGAGIITVGASDINDYRPSWSNYGKCVTLSAPGATITAAWYTSDTATQTLSGTSMSAPLVSGVAALILQQNMALSVEEVKSILVAWSTPNIIDYASVTGGGKNLLYSLIDLSVNTPPPPPPSGFVIVAPAPDGTNSGSMIPLKMTLFLLISVTLLLL